MNDLRHWEALSGVGWLQLLETVFWGSGIGPRVVGSHSRKYVHIHAYTYIYIHIHSNTNLYEYTYICVHILSYLRWSPRLRARRQHTSKYVHIHTYTYIYMHILSLFVYVSIYTFCIIIHAYTCIYLHIRSWKSYMHCTGSLNFARILNVYCMYMHVFCDVYARKCTYDKKYEHQRN
jgi:hypothetical protein